MSIIFILTLVTHLPKEFTFTVDKPVAAYNNIVECEAAKIQLANLNPKFDSDKMTLECRQLELY